MARPEKYDWSSIQTAYEGGFDKADICRQYKVANKHLSNKIYEKKWTVKGGIKADIEGFWDASQNVLKHSLNDVNIEALTLKTIDTTSDDNTIRKNNRQLAIILQKIMMQQKEDITLGNIRNVSGALKDLEHIANPTTTQINNTNATQNNETKIIIFKKIDKPE